MRCRILSAFDADVLVHEAAWPVPRARLPDPPPGWDALSTPTEPKSWRGLTASEEHANAR